MKFNFELMLAAAVLITGMIWIIDWVWLSSKRHLAAAKLAEIERGGSYNQHIAGMAKMSTWVEYSRSFFPILLLVMLLRSFLFEPFRIPSGSLEPSLLVGDFVLTNKFAYGIRLPVTHTKIIALNEPKTGDIVVFRWPVDTRQDFIKRIIGVPGDRVSYINKVLYVNGVPAQQSLQKTDTDYDEQGGEWPVNQNQEELLGIKHGIYLRVEAPAQDFSVTVPEGKYFVMGDNRDSSNDSRYWGFVPEENLVGKAILIWMSWDNNKYAVRWERLGKRIV